MIERLRKTVANAGAKKCLREFKIPMERANNPIKNRYGNIIRFKVTAS